MSLAVFKTNLLSFKPHIYNKDGILVIETGFLFRLLSLFTYYRRVEMSAQNRNISILRKVFPCYPSTIELHFDDIYYIDYSFDALTTSYSTNQWTFGERTDQGERFSVHVVTKDDQKYLLGSFMGDGSICTGMRGVMLSDDSIIDFSGTQEEESLKFVKMLSKILNVPIGQPLKDIAEMIDCPSCGHPNSLYIPKCIYCGAVLKPGDVENMNKAKEAREHFEDSLH